MTQTKFVEIGNYLKNKRVSASLSQLDVSRVLRLSSPQYVSNWERGNCCPSWKMIPSLMKIYKISEKELVKVFLNVEEKSIRQRLRKSKR